MVLGSRADQSLGFKLEVQQRGADAGATGGSARSPAVAVVTGVEPSSPAAVAGLRVGDVLESVNGQPCGVRCD